MIQKKESKDKVNLFQIFDWKEFASGWSSAFMNITITYPIYKVVFRQMLHGLQTKQAFNQILGEGYLFLYRGMLPPLAQKTVSLSVMFGVFDATRRPLVEHFNFNPYTAKTVAGIVAGSVEAAIMPFERIQTLLADSTYHKYFKNTQEACRYVWANHGFKEFYRGLVPILLRNGPATSLFFFLKEEASQKLTKKQGIYQTFQDFMSGALIGSFLSTLFYPCNVLKVSCQSTMGGKFNNVFILFKQVYNERHRKITNIYKGCSVNISLAFLSWGIMNSTYELLKNII